MYRRNGRRVIMRGELLSKCRQAARALVKRRLTIRSDGIPYEFVRLSYRKIINAFLAEASSILQPEIAWSWPTHLMVEPSTHCNLACALCPVTAGLGRPQGHMDPGTFRDVVDEIGDYLFLILLWDWGEPFLNPSVYEMIAYAKRKGISLVSSTNGHLFAGANHADRLIESGIDTIIFAIDGISQETYQHYRQGGDLLTALRGVETVAARKRILGKTTPLVNFRFIVMEHNEHEIPQARELARSLGANAFTLKTLNPASQDPYFEGEHPLHDEFLPRNPFYRRFEYDADTGRRVRRPKNPCRELWRGSVIHWNGAVCPCTYDPKERYVLGDLRQESFRDIWTGSRYRRMRRQFRAASADIPLCRECSYAFKGGNCSRETIAEALFFSEDRRSSRAASPL